MKFDYDLFLLTVETDAGVYVFFRTLFYRGMAVGRDFVLQTPVEFIV